MLTLQFDFFSDRGGRTRVRGDGWCCLLSRLTCQVSRSASGTTPSSDFGPGGWGVGTAPAEPTLLPGTCSSRDHTLVISERLAEHPGVFCTNPCTITAFGVVAVIYTLKPTKHQVACIRKLMVGVDCIWPRRGKYYRKHMFGTHRYCRIKRV